MRKHADHREDRGAERHADVLGPFGQAPAGSSGRASAARFAVREKPPRARRNPARQARETAARSHAGFGKVMDAAAKHQRTGHEQRTGEASRGSSASVK